MRIELPNSVEMEEVLFQTAVSRFGALVRSTKRLAAAIKDLSDYYIAIPHIRGRCPNSLAHQAARMVFFTPADMPKAFVVAAEFDTLSGIPRKPVVSVLDIGVGYGAQSLGLLSYLYHTGPDQRIQLDAVDRDSNALEAFGQLLKNYRESRIIGDVDYRMWDLDLAKGFRPKGSYDFIIAGNTLCELESALHYPLVVKLLSLLTECGVLFIIEPALRVTSRNLHAIRDQLLTDHRCEVVAPCTRTGGCPCLIHPGDWCHESRSYLLPPICRHFSVATGLRMSSLRWSYLTLTHQGSLKGKYARAWRAVSELLKPKGKQEIFLCGALGRVRAILPKRVRTPANESFKRLNRGHYVWIQDAEIINDQLILDEVSSVTVEDPVNPMFDPSSPTTPMPVEVICT